MILLVTYDLKGPSSRYAPLYDFLKSQRSWSHYLTSTWLISTAQSPQQIADGIKPFVEEGDFYIVVRFTNEYWGWLPKDAWAWVEKHIRSV